MEVVLNPLSGSSLGSPDKRQYDWKSCSKGLTRLEQPPDVVDRALSNRWKNQENEGLWLFLEG